MSKLLGIAQIIVSIILIALILIQPRGTGLGSSFGGEGNTYFTKRGAEKTIFILTIAIALVFLALAAAALIGK